MRLAGLLLWIACAATALGCKDKGDANAAPDPAALKAQQDLMARREALNAERKKLETQRDEVEAEIKVVTAAGDSSKLADLEKRRTELDSQIQKTSKEDSSIASEISKVAAATGDLASREAALAARERAVALREKEVWDRERESIRTLGEAAARFKESCQSTSGAPMIVQVPAPKSGNYSRGEVESVMSRAKRTMRDKGLIAGDQWAGASLENEAQIALNKGDWSTAYVTASQLVNYANQFKVDRGFVQQKIARLNQLVRGKRDEQLQKALTDGLGDVMTKFGDGNHIAANAKLNTLFGLVR